MISQRVAGAMCDFYGEIENVFLRGKPIFRVANMNNNHLPFDCREMKLVPYKWRPLPLDSSLPSGGSMLRFCYKVTGAHWPTVQEQFLYILWIFFLYCLSINLENSNFIAGGGKVLDFLSIGINIIHTMDASKTTGDKVTFCWLMSTGGSITKCVYR